MMIQPQPTCTPRDDREACGQPEYSAGSSIAARWKHWSVRAVIQIALIIVGFGSYELVKETNFSHLTKVQSHIVSTVVVGILSAGIILRGVRVSGQLLDSEMALNLALRESTVKSRQQAELLGSIIGRIPNHVFWKDLNNVYLGCNDQFAVTAGLRDRHEIVGKTDFDLPWTREESESYRHIDQQVMRSGQAVLDMEESQHTAEGVHTCVVTSKVPLRDRDTGVYGVLGIYIDISDRKRIEVLLQSRMAAIDAAADMVVITDGAGKITYVNPAFTKATGYAAEEVIGQTPRVIRSGQHGKDFYEAMWRTILSGSVWQGELVNRRKDGSLYPEEMTITPIRNDSGAVVKFVAIKRDVTVKKEQQALASERGHLRESVAAMEQVLGIVGHELRTPLAGVRAMAELLLMDQITLQDQSHFLKSINQEVVRMSGTINDLLEAARLNSGRAQWNWSVVGMLETWREAADSIAPLVDPTRVSLEVIADPESLEMGGDADAIRRLAVNLLSNAAKHTDGGSIRVHASGVEEGGKTWIRIEVTDTGRGIAPEIVSRLGEAFALNAGVVGSKHVRGAGLGLSICRGIAAAHGGRLSVRSEPGAGTSIIVMLRADLDAPTRQEPEACIVNVMPDSNREQGWTK